MPRIAVIAALVVVVGHCPGGTEPSRALPVGTWGGDNVGVVVSDTAIHVHVGCTVGDAPRPVLAADRFEVTGRHNITAYPVDRGIFHPAVFSGHVSNEILTLTVALTDTNVTLGPVVMQLGRDPRMGPCPICRPRAMRSSSVAAQDLPRPPAAGRLDRTGLRP